MTSVKKYNFEDNLFSVFVNHCAVYTTLILHKPCNRLVIFTFCRSKCAMNVTKMCPECNQI